MNPDGTGKVNVTQTPDVDEYSPAWSPDGSQIVFARYTDATFEDPFEDLGLDIFVMDADGSNVRQLTAAPGWDSGPAWSSDGRDRLHFGAGRQR